MTTNTCQKCEYFVQHYNYRDNRYHSVYCGHCTHRYHKLGRKRPDTPACKDFIIQEPTPIVRNEDLIAAVKRLWELLEKEFPPDR